MRNQQLGVAVEHVGRLDPGMSMAGDARTGLKLS
jgi:hypothetical protein